MKITSPSLLDAFALKHANARKSLSAWRKAVEEAKWQTKQEVLIDFPKAKVLANKRARFEIVHNTYRLIAEIDYADQILDIRFVGTHGEYDRIDPITI